MIKNHSRKQQNYFLNHSVGLPFPGAEQHTREQFFEPWQNQNEPWPSWLGFMESFRTQLAILLNADVDEICPQANLSSALTKIIHSLPKPQPHKRVILLSEQDFPSMGFVFEQAQSLGYELRYIPSDANLQDLNIWRQWLTEDVAICLITHVQSNNGKQLPVDEIISQCHQHSCISIVDIAQSVGLLAVDVSHWQADFVIGSCVKWLCGGPGAGFMWVNKEILTRCNPVDVGWFSHQNPFEFDIHQFDYHNTALRFWGGTPAVMSHINAAFAIEQVLALGVERIREANLAHLHTIWRHLPHEFVVSPMAASQCSGTLILDFGRQQAVSEKLKEANIAFDQRDLGLRISPHFYTQEEETAHLIKTILSAL